MAAGWRTLRGIVCVSVVMSSGCASLEELRQVQMAQRNLEAEKARLEQEIFDARNVGQSLRERTGSLEDQLAARDLLIENLDSENDNLEASVRTARELLEKIANRPLEPVAIRTAALPAELDQALEQFAARNPSAVSYDRERGNLKWTSDLLFAFASDVVKESAHGSLRRFGEIMRSPAANEFDVVVVGHTDAVRISRPQTLKKHPTNWHLSVHRAIAVGDILQKYGLESTRIGVMGFGEYRPLVTNTTSENRARNRRVEMYIVRRGAFSAGATATPAAPAAMSFTGNDPKETTK